MQTVQRYSVPFAVKVMNPLLRALLGLGLSMGPAVLLTVRGRKSGRGRTTPVGISNATAIAGSSPNSARSIGFATCAQRPERRSAAVDAENRSWQSS